MYLEIYTDKYIKKFSAFAKFKYVVYEVHTTETSKWSVALFKTNSRYELRIWFDLSDVEISKIATNKCVGLWYTFPLIKKNNT